VLIMPSERLPAYRLSKREKWMVGGVLGVVAALAVVLVISFVSPGPSSGHGCIYATIPGSVGAEQVHECGATARNTCGSVNAPGAYTRQAAQTLATECRKAGLPVGS
jgi:ABC-type Co2+ transport system permease subunit